MIDKHADSNTRIQTDVCVCVFACDGTKLWNSGEQFSYLLMRTEPSAAAGLTVLRRSDPIKHVHDVIHKLAVALPVKLLSK